MSHSNEIKCAYQEVTNVSFRKMLRTHLGAIQLLTIPSFHGTQIPGLFFYSEVLINYPKDH